MYYTLTLCYWHVLLTRGLFVHFNKDPSVNVLFYYLWIDVLYVSLYPISTVALKIYGTYLDYTGPRLTVWWTQNVCCFGGGFSYPVLS